MDKAAPVVPVAHTALARRARLVRRSRRIRRAASCALHPVKSEGIRQAKGEFLAEVVFGSLEKTRP